MSAKTVVVTGASRGIGRGIARRFAADGARVVVSADEDAVHEVAEEIRGGGGDAASLVCDVTQKGDVDLLYRTAYERYGSVDISIKIAGVLPSPPERHEDEWTDHGGEHQGVFRVAAAAPNSAKWLGRLTIRRAARAIHYTPLTRRAKGVVGITQSLAKELATDGITVNAFCPGIIDTEMWAYNDRVWGALLGNYGPGELMAEWVEGIPMKRAGTPEDVAGLVAFLASDDAAYITGQTINVDGGLIMS